MGARELALSLKRLCDRSTKDARVRLNDVSEKIELLRTDCDPRSISDDANPNFEPPEMQHCREYFRPVKKHQYENWTSRNDSRRIASNFQWNPKLDPNDETIKTRSQQLCSERQNMPKTKIKRVLISNKNYDRSSTTRSIDNRTKSKTHKKCYCADMNSSSDSLHHSQRRAGAVRASKDYSHKYFNASGSNEYDESGNKDSSHEQVLLSYEHSPENVLIDDSDATSWESLKNFRDKHYYECHSVKCKLNQKACGHEKCNNCEHNFQINERLFLQPAYADHYNRSRCRKCHLPLGIMNDIVSEESDDNDEFISKMKNSIHLERKAASINVPDFDFVYKNSDINKNEMSKINIKIPYRDDLIIPHYDLMNANRSQVHKNNKNKLEFDTNKRPAHSYDSAALRYQKGFKDLSNTIIQE